MSAGLAFSASLITLAYRCARFFGIETARCRLALLLFRAQIGPDGVIELQIAAAGVVEGLDGLLIGGRQIVEDRISVRIGRLVHGVRLKPEMHYAGTRDGHLGRDLGVRLQIAEMLQHRVRCGEAYSVVDVQRQSLGLDTLELDAVIGADHLDPVQHAEEVEMPPGAAKLAVGGKLQADLLLMPDDLVDLGVLHLLQFGGGDLILLAPGSRVLDRRGAQQASDDIGPIGRPGSAHGMPPVSLSGLLDRFEGLELDIVELAVDALDLAHIDVLHDVPRLRIDRDRSARAFPGHALHGLDESVAGRDAFGLLQCLVD
jgi:hypothetical protein